MVPGRYHEHDWEVAYTIVRTPEMHMVMESFLRSSLSLYVTRADLLEIIDREFGLIYKKKVCLKCKECVDEYDGIPQKLVGAFTDLDNQMLAEEQRLVLARKIWKESVIE